MNKENYTYKVEEIFTDIPDDPENVLMTIPPELCEKLNWKPGDKIKVELGDQGTIILNKL